MAYIKLLSDPQMNYTLNRPLADGTATALEMIRLICLHSERMCAIVTLWSSGTGAGWGGMYWSTSVSKRCGKSARVSRPRSSPGGWAFVGKSSTSGSAARATLDCAPCTAGRRPELSLD